MLGTTTLTKALTPSHYGETKADPPRTMCLLKAWTIWRFRKWTSMRPCRTRQLAKMIEELTAEIRVLDARAVITSPIFHNVRAQRLFGTWVPDVVAAIVVP